MIFETFIGDNLGFIYREVWVPFWPFFAFFILVPIARSAWLFWRQQIFKGDIKWVVLELKIPREIKKSPRAMEQVFSSIHQLRNAPGDLREWYWDGEVTRWYCFEIVSFGGDVHFYIRCYHKQKNLIRASFYSYYPDVEIVDVPDYVDRFPTSVSEVYAQGYDLWGGEMKLAKEGAYPIKIHEEFESPDEEHQIDPMSTLLEMFGSLHREEILALQILVTPAATDWGKEFKKLIDKLRDTKTKQETKTGPEGQLESFARFISRSPGETDVLKSVELNLSKQAFATTIRFLYFSPKQIFYDSIPRRALKSVFNQYAALDLNYFEINYKVATRTKIWDPPFIFPGHRVEFRKGRILYNYRHRKNPPKLFMEKFLTSYLFDWNFKSKSFIMTTQTLATIFHMPTHLVLTTPHMQRVESRKGSPPAGLAIFGEEKELERFQ